RSMIATYGITYQDYERFDTITTVIRKVPMRIVAPLDVRYLNRMHNSRLVATTPEYTEVNKLELAVGRFLTEEDDRLMRNVCVLGTATAQTLFPFEGALDQSVLLYKHRYKVIGVCRERMPTGGAGGSQAAEEFNSDVYIPLQTCRVRIGEKIMIRQTGAFSGEKVDLSQVTLTVGSMEEVRPAADVVTDLLERHQKKDWSVTIPLDILK